MKNIYSLVFYPAELIDSIRQMKLDLKNQIGWYHSVNSEAHITINEFEADEAQFLKVRAYLQNFVCGLKPYQINFEGFGAYPNGAFFLQPDNSSIIYMKEIMDQLHKTFPLPVRIKSSEPHLTIARRLSPEKLAQVKAMLGNGIIDFSFLCNAITVRKFNEDRKQFEVLEKFAFKPDKERQILDGEQFELF